MNNKKDVIKESAGLFSSAVSTVMAAMGIPVMGFLAVVPIVANGVFQIKSVTSDTAKKQAKKAIEEAYQDVMNSLDNPNQKRFLETIGTYYSDFSERNTSWENAFQEIKKRVMMEYSHSELHDAFTENEVETITTQFVSSFANHALEKEELSRYLVFNTVSELQNEVSAIKSTVSTELEKILSFINESKDYRANYALYHSGISEDSSSPYTESPSFDRILSDFINYSWHEEVESKIKSAYAINDGDNETDRNNKKADKAALIDLLESGKPVSDRKTGIIAYIDEKKKENEARVNGKVLSIKDTLVKKAYGNCLFISGYYGVGKTRAIKHFEATQSIPNLFACYLDVIKTGGKLNENIIDNLIQRCFGDYYERTEKLLNALIDDHRNETIILIIDNIDYAFQNGLTVKALQKLINRYSIYDQLKWIFTLQSGQRYLITKSNSLTSFEEMYCYKPRGKEFNHFFREFDLDMNEISFEDRVFDKMLRESCADSDLNEIRLRKNGRYKNYLIPYIANIMIYLNMSWKDIVSLEAPLYLELCIMYNENKRGDIVHAGTFAGSSADCRVRYHNLCIDISKYMLSNGKDEWEKEEASINQNISKAPLEQIELIKWVENQDLYGRIIQKYLASDTLFWAEECAEMLERLNPVNLGEVIIPEVIAEKNSIAAGLGFFTELRILYLLRIYRKDTPIKAKMESELFSQSLRLLYKSDLYPTAAQAFMYADEKKKELFYRSGMEAFSSLNENDELDPHIFLSSFFEFCKSAEMGEEDWQKLIKTCADKYSYVSKEHVASDLADLISVRRSELNEKLLDYILAYLGNQDAGIYEKLARVVCDRYFEIFPDEEKLIKHLLSSGLLRTTNQNYKSKKSRIIGDKNPNTIIVNKTEFPYCLIENTFCKICDRIISKHSIKDGHSLFWKNGWYSEKIRFTEGRIPFFVNLRRKALNLSLTDYARRNDKMDELIELINICLSDKSNNAPARAAREEAMYLCRNSVLAADKSPFSYEDEIYEKLIQFIDDESMSFLMNSGETKAYYTKHNLFKMFEKKRIELEIYNPGMKKTTILCEVVESDRGKITVKDKGNIETYSWEKIIRISDPFRKSSKGRK